MGNSKRQLKAMLRKNWLLKTRHPWVTLVEIMLPAFVMFMLIAVRTRVDTKLHPTQAYIRKGMFVEVGNSDISPSLERLLKFWFATGEHLAFAPDTEETKTMLNVLSMRFPLLQLVARTFKDEIELEAYIRSREYGTHDSIRNITHPKIKGAIVFHKQGPHIYDYSIRLNHSWAPSGFPDVKSIMDTNGPYVNDLELGVDIRPTLQYGFSGFLTLQQVLDSFIIFSAQWNGSSTFYDKTKKGDNLDTQQAQSCLENNHTEEKHHMFGTLEENSEQDFPWTLFRPSNISIAPFPTREYTDDEFQSIVKKVMGVLYLLGFLYPVSRLISYSVYEKEQKIKEGLHMMGLKDHVFYLSWFITYAIQFAVSAAIITICTMNSIFQYSDKSVVFTYFFIFGLSAIMLSFLITTFFSSAKTAVAVGTLSFLGAFFPYYTVIDETIPMAGKVIASLLSPTAFALGTVNFADYEHAHVGLRWSNIWKASSGVNFLVCLLLMVFDSIVYCAIGLYLDKVLPQDYGVQLPWNFFCTLGFWKEKSRKPILGGGIKHYYGDDNLGKNDHSNEGKKYFEPSIESVSSDLKQQENDGRCIQIRNLQKVYKSPKGKCCAVNDLELSLYENQILALLGHNGAGKSTTIAMLVGLLPPTSGDALVFGKSIRTDMEKIRKQLGVCPQHDILFPELTVKEHLKIFGILKGVEDDVLEIDVDEMINEIGLHDKTNTVVRALSGGMKRKLSLAIALIGNSKVVILDEPTSGMDPYSMRSTWQLIKRFKKGRVILLTTHSMDEADILGDRIAIMANGSLRCCGSSPFLKHRYGVGYTLTLVKKSQCASSAADIVFRHVPSATLLTDVGSELSFRLPLASASSFEGLFREIENCIESRCNSTVIERENTAIEKYHCIESYGISVTTLEEVFLRVAGSDFDNNESYVSVKDNVDVEEILEPCFGSGDEKVCNIKGDRWLSTKTAKKIFSAVCSSFILILSTFCSILCLCRTKNHYVVDDAERPPFWEHFKALVIKRAICARRDKRTIAFQLLVPALFLFLGLFLLKLKPHPDQICVTLTTDNFNPLLRSGGGGGPISFNLSLPIAIEVASNVKGGWIQREKPCTYKFPNTEQAMTDAIYIAGPYLGPSLLSMSEYLITSLNESYQSRYGAVVMNEPNIDGSLGYTVLHNTTCQHAAPTYINVMNSAILRLATHHPNMTIRTRNHPLPMTESQHSQHHDLDAFSAAIIVTIAFSFIPSSFAVPIVKEREVKAKHQQIISGVSLVAYWISTYAWDFISYLLPASLAMLFFYIFGLEQFVGRDNFGPTLFMLLGYGPAVAASTYALTFFFTDYSVAQNVVLLVQFFSGLILMIISFIMGLIRATKHTNRLLKNFFRLSPGFCLADGLASLALRRQGMKFQSGEQPLDWDITGASICYLVLEVAETRFASHTIVLRRLVRVKEALCQMVISNKWGGWKQVDTEKAKIVKDLIFSDDFWNRVEYALELTEPLMSMLRYADTDEPCLGNIYDAMDSMLERMKSVIQRREQDPDTLYSTVEKIVLHRWNKMTTPLHLLAYALSPRYYSSEILDIPGRVPPYRDPEVAAGYKRALNRLFSDPDVASNVRREFVDFVSGKFAEPDAINDQSRLDAIGWWYLHGERYMYLQPLAIKILSQSIIYFVLVMGFDLLPSMCGCWSLVKSWLTQKLDSRLYSGSPKGMKEPFIISTIESHASVLEDEDEDVRAERLRVLSGEATDSIIYLKNLRKVYPGSVNQPEKVAVQSLSFAVHEGECFGFLGTNGAGKSTTLSMLSGEGYPTEGTAYIFGKDILSNPKASHQQVGYCPQFDALLELLTVREHLELYARIKRVPKSRFNQVVEDKLTEFDLWPQENKPSSSLSGGNKRKLSVAIAMIGDPPLVFLDEPSTGMDPIAKRFMWDVISRISTRQGKTAVILTTHSMNEAQALCTRIGIMVEGQLCCLGSPQHLKTRFGNYLELEVKPMDVSVIELDNLCNLVQDMLFDFPSHSRSILSDLESCIGGSDAGPSHQLTEATLSQDIIIAAGHMLGHEEYVQALITNSPSTDGVFSEQLSEQLSRDGDIPIKVFCEWWLTKERVARIDSFVFSSFPGATFQGRNGYNLSYQLPYQSGASLADIFGHLEYNREKTGIAEYSIGQSTLETIFNHFAAKTSKEA